MTTGHHRSRGVRDVDDVVHEPLENTIDPENFTPRLLALLSNALVWRESTELRRRFGLGTNDWRILSVLAMRPGVSATEVSDFIDVNKAIISKSVNALVGRHLIVLSDGPRGSRPLYLTRAGAEMHDQMMPISLAGQDVILDGMDPAEIRHLNEVLRAMLDRMRATGATPPHDGV